MWTGEIRIETPVVSLTFDDGPDPTWTPRVLRALKEADAKATFFVVTPLAKRYPGLIQDTIGDGHRVELHCIRHVRHTEMTRSEVEEDTRLGLRDLRELGVEPELCRPPWGICASWTGEVAREAGLVPALWTEDTHDWRGDEAEQMLNSISDTLRSGSVILMHDGLGPGTRRSGCEQTVRLIGMLAQRIREIGCESEPLTPELARSI